MPPALLAVLAALSSLFRSRASLQAEVLSLRHQLLVLDRQRTGKRVPLRTSDRIFWSWLSRLWPGWRQSLVIVQPETVIRWHRQGFRLYWRRKSRSQPPGRPPIDSEIQELILEMHDGQVVFPNLGLACNGGDEPPEYYQAWARAHNDFVWEVFAVEEDWSPGWGD